MSKRWSLENNDAVYIAFNYPAALFRRAWRRLFG